MSKESIKQFIWLLDLLEAEALQEVELAERAANEGEQPTRPVDVQQACLEENMEAGPMAIGAQYPATLGTLQTDELPPIRDVLCQAIRTDRLPILAYLQELGQQIRIPVEPAFLRVLSAPVINDANDRPERLQYISWLRARAAEKLEHIGSPSSSLNSRPWLGAADIARLYPGITKNAIDCCLRRLSQANPTCRIRNPHKRTGHGAKFLYLTCVVLPELDRKFGAPHCPTVLPTVE